MILDKKSILEEMVFDEEEEFIKLVDKAKIVVKIRKSDSKPIVLYSDKLTAGEQIACFILGKFFAKEMELTDTPVTTIDEISNSLKIDKNVVRARLSELIEKNIVERLDRGKFQISFVKLENFLDNLIDKINNE